ncbi:MAG: hypothetical protein Q4C74_02815 [Rothia sp. (in: high G+C Gram-positive bacteria)]|nr:hypothetical protein [Rothia sp. (in: high G+C Gram-positive bacteria)]
MDYLIALLPSVCAGIILYFILRWISRADRTERQAQQSLQEDAAQWYETVKNSKGTRDPFGSKPANKPK